MAKAHPWGRWTKRQRARERWFRCDCEAQEEYERVVAQEQLLEDFRRCRGVLHLAEVPKRPKFKPEPPPPPSPPSWGVSAQEAEELRRTCQVLMYGPLGWYWE